MTQVVDAGQGRSFHNRLVHTHKVEQVARRIAEMLIVRDVDACEVIGGLSVSACEAASLAHDLGHPPFGHAAEGELDRLARQTTLHVDGTGPPLVPDGFEGNAQTFRIVTRLARRNLGFAGLNLTARTLNGVLKYPRARQAAVGHANKKFGTYGSELEIFKWARERRTDFFLNAGDEVRTAEAQVMDLADDITYAVHDIEDFYRAGLVPLHLLLDDDDRAGERSRFLRGVRARWQRENNPRVENFGVYELALARVFDPTTLAPAVALTSPYRGEEQQRAALRSITSTLISRYVQVTSLRPDAEHKNSVVTLGEHESDLRDELTILKQLIWHYVITAPALAHQQMGQTAIIQSIWQAWVADARSSRPKLLPVWAREALERITDANDVEEVAGSARGRVVMDAICSMSEMQAGAVFRRITGHDAGSVLDAIVDA